VTPEDTAHRRTELRQDRGRLFPSAPGSASPMVGEARSLPATRVVAARHRPRDSAMRRLLAASDLLALAGVQLVVLVLVGRRPELEQVLWAAAALPIWIVLFKSYGLYDRDIKRISHTTVDDVPWVFHAALLGSLLFWLYFRAVPARQVNARELLAIAALSIVAVLVLRAFTRRAANRLLGAERVLLVGEGPQIDLIARKMRAHREYGLDPVGVLSTSETPAVPGRLRRLGRLRVEDLSRVAVEHSIDRVVVSHRDVVEAEVLELVRRCRGLWIKVSLLPQLFDAMGPSVVIDDVEGVTVLGISPPVLPRSSRMLKRAMDLAGAAVLLVVLAPLLALVALAVKLDSPGPVLFWQERVGRGGRRFMLVKFRTMVIGAEARQQELAAQSRDPHWLLLEHDPRITRIGRLLRLASVDELPELWNVLKGEMSLVGPRPLIESEHRQLTEWSRTRVDLTPGLTGLWQVLGRTNIPFEEMIKLDYLYVTNWSLWTDVRLILRTLPVVVARRGAN
jgi:exopolysaccharide biosynthesis polyprenyl glycosylphosphotransferase